MGLLANVLRQGRISGGLAPRSMIYDDCTMNGWSSHYDMVTVLNADGPFEDCRLYPGVFIRRHRSMNRLHVVSAKDEYAGRCTMMGGNFLTCSDSRFDEACRKLLDGYDQFVGAIPIHDRVE